MFLSFLSWREKRKFIIIFIIAISLLSYFSYKLYPKLFPMATCNDGLQNNGEKGVDCGGACQLICTFDVLLLKVKFAKALQTEKDLYDIVALVQNKNKDKNIKDGNINYFFSLYDNSGSLIQIINGSSTIPLGQDFPIILQNIFLPIASSGNEISKVILTILNDKVWYPSNSSLANVFFKTLKTDFKNGDDTAINPSRLAVEIKNLTKNYFRNIPVRVLLYDKDNNLIAVNETVLDQIDDQENKTISFTWRNSFPIPPIKIEVYPIITPATYFR